MKTYIKPEIECITFDITTPTNARTLEEWIAIDEATKDGLLGTTSLGTDGTDSSDYWNAEWNLSD